MRLSGPSTQSIDGSVLYSQRLMLLRYLCCACARARARACACTDSIHCQHPPIARQNSPRILSSRHHLHLDSTLRETHQKLSSHSPLAEAPRPPTPASSRAFANGQFIPVALIDARSDSRFRRPPFAAPVWRPGDACRGERRQLRKPKERGEKKKKKAETPRQREGGLDTESDDEAGTPTPTPTTITTPRRRLFDLCDFILHRLIPPIFYLCFAS